MKYIIDVEKIEGTNLWKTKEFNTLVFDENGLMRMITLEDELGDYYVDLRNEVEELREDNKWLFSRLEEEKHQHVLFQHLSDEQELELNILKKSNKELKKSNNHLEKEWKEWDNICSRLKNKNKALVEQNSALEDEVVDFEVMCTKLHNEKAELLEKINSLENKLLEKSVPIEEVVDTEQVVRLMTNQFEHSEREYGRLLHTIKSQKGIIKKQGKDISRLQKENKKLKIYEKMVKRID